MDLNSSLGKICLGEDVVVISSDKVEGSGDWNSLEFQDTANSGQKKETKDMVFYQMDTEEVSNIFMAPCFVNGLEAYDGEINLGVEENIISNEYAFVINPEEDDVKPGVIFERSFLRMTKAITDFLVGTITIYPDIDPFLEETEEEEKSNDDWDHLLDFNIDDVPMLGEEGLPPFVCKMRKSSRNKKRAMEKLNFFYQDIGTSSSTGGHLTQEEAAKEALTIRMSRNFALLEDERPIIETMAYHNKYKKILDEVWKEKVELEGQVNENALADTGSDINTMPYRIYEQLGREDMKKYNRGITMINHTQAEAMGILTNVLYQFSQLLMDFVTKIFCAARSDVMRNAESDSDDTEEYQIKGNKFGAPIYGPKPAYVWKKAVSFLSSLPVPLKNVNWKPDYKGSYTKEEEATGQWRTEIRLIDPYGNIYLQGFTTKKTDRKLSKYHKLSDIMSPNMGCDGEIDDMLRIRLHEDGLDEEIFTSVAWIRAFNINEPIFAELCHEFYLTYEFDEVCTDDELQTKKIIKFKLGGRAHSLTLLEFARRLGLYQAVELEDEGFNVYFEGGLRSDGHFNAQDYWLSISRKENLGLSKSHTSIIKNPILRVIHKMITYGLCQRTTGLVNCKMDEEERRWHSKGKSTLLCLFISKIARKCRVLTEDVVRSLSAPIYFRDLDTTTLKDLIDSKGGLIPEDPQPGVPRVGILRPLRASMQDLYDRMGRMKIRQEAIERMEYRQSYH
ncbi:hypothetical protein Tco_0797194 [Tanacetum coccineum]